MSAHANMLRSIAFELRQHPERWTKGTPARDEHGMSCPATDERRAVCWCLQGFIEREWYNNRLLGDFVDLHRPLRSALAARNVTIGNDTVLSTAYWNDHIAKSAADVATLFDEAAALVE